MAWTTIDADTSWQELAIAQECVDAFNSRVAALTSDERESAGVEIIYDSEFLSESDTVFDVVSALQDGIEKMATYFSDPSASLTGSASYPSSFASVAAMMTAAGLTQSGYWRRIAEGGTQPSAWTSYTAAGWSYGKITDKDLAGPWLWIDLETALSALTRRVFDVDDPALRYEGKSFSAQNSYPAITGTITYPHSLDLNATFSIAKQIYVNGISPYPWYTDASLYINLRTYSLTDLLGVNKTISLVGKPKRQSLYSDNEWKGTTFGTGWTIDGKTFVLSSTTTDETSVSLNDAAGFTLWSTYAAYVPWPPKPDPGSTYYNTINIRAYAGCFVVDYAFDP